MPITKEVEFVLAFSQEDRYRHYHLRIKGQVIDFVVQYETFINGKWFPVVRYDTSHGFAHRDLLNIKHEKRKTPLFITDKNDALTFAENDIKDNWEVYKQRFLREAKI
ncbi:MAG: hypothetical protein KAV83_13615 [Desulfobacterales bacterium]|nr:hypothetical protein [Desulfobacterales bacterium]